MGLDAKDSLSEELSMYVHDIVQCYREAGAKPDAVIFINPCAEGLQVVVMRRTDAVEVLDKAKHQFGKSLQENFPALVERLSHPLREGYVLLLLDGLTTSGWVDFNYAGWIASKSIPYQAKGSEALN